MTRFSVEDEKSSSVCKIFFSHVDGQVEVGLARSTGAQKANPKIAEDAFRFMNPSNDSSFQYHHDSFGRPFVSSENPLDWNLSISYSDEKAAALCFPQKFLMGLDLEKIDEVQSRTARSVLTTNEIQLRALTGLSETIFQLMTWTIKEAVAKQIGFGFQLPLETFEIQNIEMKQGYWKSSFSKFPSSTAYSWIEDDHVFSLSTSSALTLKQGLPPGLVSAQGSR